jgi:HEPN domain-containing protein/predicted nucleotidyltransferase
MAKKRSPLSKPAPRRWYRGKDIPMRVIRRFALQVAETFRPEKIILFGSYAYGTPHADSDVDVLVVMPARNQLGMAFKIHWTIQPPFPLDIIVRTPKEMEWRLGAGDWFLREIVSKGKVLYPNDRARAVVRTGYDEGEMLAPRGGARRLVREWQQNAENHFRAASLLIRLKGTSDSVCRFCQQAAELYLKALVQRAGLPMNRTRDLKALLDLLLAYHPALEEVRPGLVLLTKYAVDVWEPGHSWARREAKTALRWAGRVRSAARAVLGVRGPRRQTR